MKKIMYNDKYGLTKAVLEGRKTQTRRICAFGSNTYEKAYRNLLSNYKDGSRFRNELLRCSLYKVGEEVAIAQSYKDVGLPEDVVLRESKDGKFKLHHFYVADAGWNNKMFVKSDLMPHRIKITNIRIERLHDISDEDCVKEGVDLLSEEFIYYGAKEAFATLIDKVSGKGTWESNPYVFVYDFKLIK